MEWELIVILISLVASLITAIVFIALNFKNNYNAKVQNHCRLNTNESTEILKFKFSKNSEIGELIDSIQLWELTNRGETHSKEQEEAEAEEYSNFLKSEMYLKLAKIMEEHDGSGS